MKQQEFVDLYTPESKALSQQPWQSYPRPQMRRSPFGSAFDWRGQGVVSSVIVIKSAGTIT